MAHVIHNKLVRDRIKETIEKNGERANVRALADNREFESALRDKVIEEATELAATVYREDFLKEYADLMITLDALTNLLEFSEADIKTAIEENLKRKGGFEKRHYLESTE